MKIRIVERNNKAPGDFFERILKPKKNRDCINQVSFYSFSGSTHSWLSSNSGQNFRNYLEVQMAQIATEKCPIMP